ncbi:DNA repair protein RecO [Chloroflexota bacterium]
MTKPRTFQTEAIIIKKVKLGEADRILTLYTPGWGKIRGVAKGVRRPKSKLAGHLELLTHSLVSLARGRNLDTVIGSKTLDSFLTVKSDLRLIAYALYAVELIDQFTAEHIENLPLFQLVLEVMRRLCQPGTNDLVLRYFELHLLDKVGYRPQFGQCVSCHMPLKPVINLFYPAGGGVLCPDCNQSQSLAYPLPVNALKVLRLLQSRDYNTAGRLKIDSSLSLRLEWVMRSFITFLLERELKSTAWLDTFRGQNNDTQIRSYSSTAVAEA